MLTLLQLLLLLAALWHITAAETAAEWESIAPHSSEHIPDTYPGRKKSQTEKILKNQRKVRLRK